YFVSKELVQKGRFGTFQSGLCWPTRRFYTYEFPAITSYRLLNPMSDSNIQVEPQSLKTLLNAGRPAHQIIFDPDRVHYVVVNYDPQARIVVLYDSLVEKDANVTNLVRNTLLIDAIGLFGHYTWHRVACTLNKALGLRYTLAGASAVR
ncbi:unnamed protein product, partial [Heligmosomoides polygyrus]|uniref:Peptidase_C39_2 domain-containing protein n=1 Tax=Heligmosomoides polygyrus TaxID=6339 RepID=A0A183GWG0_HELPZ